MEMLLVAAIMVAVIKWVRFVRAYCADSAERHAMVQYVDALRVHTLPEWASKCTCMECRTPMSRWTKPGLPQKTRPTKCYDCGAGIGPAEWLCIC